MNNKSPLVTVLMPVFNGEKYLKEAIDSVLNQTFTDFEFLIINDGSTDNTSKILASYNDSRIRVIHQENKGVAKSLNEGINLAKGSYIWRHDADDICLSNQLEKQLTFLKHQNSFAIVSTQIAFMTDNGKIAYDYKQPKDLFFNGNSFIKVERKHFNPYSPITHATVLIKKEVFNSVGKYRTEFKTSEDTDLWLRVLEQYDIAVLHFCSYFVRLNSSSATQVFKNTTSFYRDLAFQYADERIEKGFDSLQLGEQLQVSKEIVNRTNLVNKNNKGIIFRNDLLDFTYKVMLNAKDFKNICKIIFISLKDGWRLKKTYKALLYPLLGNKLLNKLVTIKKIFK